MDSMMTPQSVVLTPDPSALLPVEALGSQAGVTHRVL